MANGVRFNKGQIQCSVVHDNTSQQLIHITEDKLKLILTKHLSDLELSKSWHLPLTIFVTLLTVAITTSPKAIFGLSADVWQAMLVLCCIGSLIWTVVKFIRSKTVEVCKIDELLEIIKTPR